MNRGVRFSAALLGASILLGCASRDRERAAAAGPPAITIAYSNSPVSPGTKFAALPAPVKHAVRAQAGAAEIANIFRRKEGSITFYEITFDNSELYPPLEIAPDGSVLNPNLSVAVGAPSGDFETSVPLKGAGGSGETARETLPSAVLEAIGRRASVDDISHFSTQPWGERTLYMIEFKDDSGLSRMFVTSDGTILQELPP